MGVWNETMLRDNIPQDQLCAIYGELVDLPLRSFVGMRLPTLGIPLNAGSAGPPAAHTATSRPTPVTCSRHF